jgi:hypothetical protein
MEPGTNPVEDSVPPVCCIDDECCEDNEEYFDYLFLCCEYGTEIVVEDEDETIKCCNKNEIWCENLDRKC